jgi:hypothetical protein
MSCVSGVDTLNLVSLYMRAACHTLSKAFSTSRYMAAVAWCLFQSFLIFFC